MLAIDDVDASGGFLTIANLVSEPTDGPPLFFLPSSSEARKNSQHHRQGGIFSVIKC